MTLKYFDIDEFACSETGENEISYSFVTQLDALREACGFPFVITSGYRSTTHSSEVSKPNGPGQHCLGIAADIAVNGGAQRFILVKQALEMEFTGIGVAKSFIHIDQRETTPMMWSY